MLVLIVWGAAALDGEDIDQAASVAVIALLAMAACFAAYWRHFQYGLGVKRRSKGTPDRRRRGTPFSDNMMLV
ncbi:MAG: hypothetical protein LCH74_18965, partial [Proteobacteria bacterium]|nr:hypothetical protein [Pseudomonadota bacterium]